MRCNKSRAHTRTSPPPDLSESLVGSVQEPTNQHEQSFISEREREEIEREAGGVHGLEPIKIQVELEQ